jgi:hypothetical protein
MICAWVLTSLQNDDDDDDNNSSNTMKYNVFTIADCKINFDLNRI